MICDTDTDTDSGLLHCELTELTPPWLDAPETLVFRRGVATDAGLWGEWLPLLAPHFRLVRFDLRGFGRSAGGSGGDPGRLDRRPLRRRHRRRRPVSQVPNASTWSANRSAAPPAAAHPRAPARQCSRCRASARRTAARRSGCYAGWRDELRSHGMQAWSDAMMERRFPPGTLGRDQRDWFARTQAAADPEALIADRRTADAHRPERRPAAHRRADAPPRAGRQPVRHRRPVRADPAEAAGLRTGGVPELAPRAAVLACLGMRPGGAQFHRPPA